MTDPSGPPSTHSTRTVSVSFDLSRLPSIATAFGVALVSSAILVSALYSQRRGELDGPIFAMGLLATVGLLAVAVGAHLLVADAERSASLVSWPGAAGIVGAGIMSGVAIADDPKSIYTAGAVVLAVSVLSYLVTKAAPFVLTTILGLAVLYAQGFSDVVDMDGDSTNSFIIFGAAVLVFVGAVTAVGWLLPKTRVLSAVVVGVGAIFALAQVFTFVAAFGALASAAASDDGLRYSGSYEQLQGDQMDEPYISEDACCDDDSYSEDDDYGYAEDDSFFEGNSYRNAIWVMLSYGVALAVFWALCALATGQVAFRIMSVAILLFSVPATVFALAVSHPTWWQVGLTAGGGLLLGAAGLRLLKTAPPPPAV